MLTKHQINKWYTGLDMTCYKAGQEKPGWSKTDLGVKIKRMPTKEVSGYLQTGDYYLYLNDYDYYCGILAERKSIADLYGTMFSKRATFYKEIDRFGADERFEEMIIFVEGTVEDFMIYQPTFHRGQFMPGAAMKIKDKVYHMHTEKWAAINVLFSKGIPCHFSPDAKEAADNFMHVSEYWLKRNHDDIVT